MPRPRKTNPTKEIAICISQDHLAELKLELFSPLEGRIPHGKISEWFETISREALARVRAARAQGELNAQP